MSIPPPTAVAATRGGAAPPPPRPAAPPRAAHDEVHWMAIAIETVAVVSAVAFAWMHSR